ncbi:MAG: O-acetyl-ADP-ribose deacetylase [Candidatus Saccharimonadales bacterium]|nr:O-acetyl-ADP-ribose deacetylase [Candidatus Saccharimonadales bacterium]
MRIKHVEGDITTQKVDAIVNAANESLLGGGGVDGAIHAAAGPKLLDECRAIGGCAFGDAKITGGYNLPARFVIHAVGPIYKEHGNLAPMLLAGAYRSSLELAEANGVKTLAFPAISTGAYGYPPDEAAAIAVSTIRLYRSEHPNSKIKEVRLISFDKKSASVMAAALRRKR